MEVVNQKLQLYLQVTRMDKPIGSFLLLWPTWWALWLASDGLPKLSHLLIFTLGVFLTRSAGCIVNDVADYRFDSHVERTRNRPLTTGALARREALVLAVCLCFIAFILILFTNRVTILLSFVAILLTTVYPYMKRYTHLPQVVLGAAFSWGVPMAFSAVTGSVPPLAWLVFCTALIWTVVYDTFYAMVDRNDDIKLGIKSTAILFGEADRLVTLTLQALIIFMLFLIGRRFELGHWYSLALFAGACIFIWQQWLIRQRSREGCFRAFLNNNVFGLAIFAGIAIDLAY